MVCRGCYARGLCVSVGGCGRSDDGDGGSFLRFLQGISLKVIVVEEFVVIKGALRGRGCGGGRGRGRARYVH